MILSECFGKGTHGNHAGTTFRNAGGAMLGEPDSVGGAVELVTGKLHLPRSDFEHHGLAVTLADLGGRACVRGEVDVLPIAL